jgi:predicted nucleotidyltransferase
MDLPDTMPENKQLLLRQLVSELGRVPGMAAVVLGGSYASGRQREGSDMDIGLYYLAEAPFEIARIKRLAEDFALQPPTVTGFYEWGQWVNGGAWIQTEAGKVDFLYRNINQIDRAIDNAFQGIVEHDYGQQPTHGFYSIIYLAETQVCIPLFDPQMQMRRLKQRVEIYPPKLKEKVVTNSLWSAEFTLVHAGSFSRQGDVYNTAGCLTRISANLTQALFALNKRYFISDKRVMEVMAQFAILPARYIQQVTGILAHPGETIEELTRAVAQMRAVWQGVAALAGDDYRPKFNL